MSSPLKNAGHSSNNVSGNDRGTNPVDGSRAETPQIMDLGFILQLQIEDWQWRSAFLVVVAQRMKLMSSSPLGPVEQMLNAVPSSPEQMREQVAQFGYAERHLPGGSFFLRVRAE